MKNNNKITNLLKETKATAFNNATKIKDFSNDKKTPYSKWPESWKRVNYKAYPRMEQVLLPIPSLQKWSLSKALANRESKRKFTMDNIKIKDLSSLLYFSAGLKSLVLKKNENRRFYPSAGARYPLEIYPFVFHVENIKPAIYHYHLKSHSLEKILAEPFYKDTMKQFSQPWIHRASVLFVISAIFDRTEGKYGDRGLRHVYTEYGHIAQNISLIAEELGLGCCSIGGFVDDGLNTQIDFDKIDESVIGVIAVGTVK